MRQGIAFALVIVILGAVAASGQTVKNDPQASEQLRAAYGRLAGLKSYRMDMKMAPGALMGGQRSMENLAMVMEVVPPDRFRMTGESDDFAMENITVAGETRYRLTKMKEQPQQPGGGMGVLGILSMVLSFALNPAGALIGAASTAVSSMMAPGMGAPPVGVWQCPPKMGAGGPQGPGGKTGGEELAVSRLDDATIDGAATQVFLATQTGQGQGPSFVNKMRVYVLKDGGLPRRIEMLDTSDKPTMTMDYRDYDAPITIQQPRAAKKHDARGAGVRALPAPSDFCRSSATCASSLQRAQTHPCTSSSDRSCSDPSPC